MGTTIGSKVESNPATGLNISFLSNAFHWHISAGIIAKVKEHYILMLLYPSPDNRLMRYKKEYSTALGARIAFFRRSRQRHFLYDPQKKKLGNYEKPVWTHIYQPDDNWLKSNFPELLLNTH
jgi:hypothetical protein